MRLRLIADDLTGALDAAAPFAREAAPVRLTLSAGGDTPALSHSTESRDLAEPHACGLVRDAARRMADPSALWFKKVDSVLRGHPLAETLAMMAAGGFARCIFAPAFPEMGRITREGRQLVQDGGTWRETAQGDLRAAFARLAPEREIHVPDAQNAAELRAAIRPWTGMQGTLWAGSRGLAEALAAPSSPLPRPEIGLFILGTAHPATRAQAAALAPLIRPASGAGLDADSAKPVLLDPVPLSADARETHARLRDSLSRLQPGGAGAIFVTGGDCLSLVLAQTGTEALDCIGEAGPGIPVSRVIGGRFDGRLLVSKSGGFGGADLLTGFLRR